MPFEGFADSPAAGVIRGWAWNTDASDTPVLVEATDGQAFYSRAAAEGFREELQHAGKRAGYCAFEIPVPSDAAAIHVLLDGTPDRLRSPPSPDHDPVRDWLDGAGAALRSNILVHRLTYDLLGRAANPLELARFAPRTGTPYEIARLVRDIMDQAPAAGLLTYRDFIRHAYLGVLNRAADQGGLAHFSHALLTGTSPSQMIRDLVGSTEFTARQAKAAAPDRGPEQDELARLFRAAITTLTLHGTAPADPTRS